MDTDKMTKLFSYVVDHDLGFAPNPFGGFCTLAKCKLKEVDSIRRNVIELAEEGDWIAGTGGADRKKSAGNGKLIYAMRVDDKLSLAKYCKAFSGQRLDAEHDEFEQDRFALISHHFFYFGRNAIPIADLPKKHLDHPFEKKGPGFRSDFSEEFISDFAAWLKSRYHAGVHGPPCKPHSQMLVPKCRPRPRLKRGKAKRVC
jgi:hypothetical protein